ncbi:DUF3426 domain-containing protein [Pseudoxanthomonas sp. PXM01]|uniref:DUF3426 domain-containing protein n=1 Tax=Pseudoxanthomonas sp. PXM01 TaxID=2769295 RepID=UPI00177F2A3E|nr:DUF3426 domain-containing protein [Pseudoxanthomonas sp. PXM01]MBD9470277.1 DUF3426 domain-containing protein [Pseudoxanthomonas sp. PXM01]
MTAMFTACPHCQFLVARDPHSDASPADCPRCGKPLATVSDAPVPAPSLATLLHPLPAVAETDPVHVPPIADGATETPSSAPADTLLPVAQAGDVATHADTDTDGDAKDVVDGPSGTTAHDATTAIEGPSTTDAPAPPVDALLAAPPRVRKAPGPRFLRRARTTPVHARRARLQWAAVAAMSLLLCIQIVIADRARLATQAGWRPLVMALCGTFGCEVPTWREPDAFTMLSRDVRPLLDAPGTLQAQATFRNEARWPQAWPVILLTLKDADGRTLGARALEPVDYLPDDQLLTTIEPGQSAQMAVRIREPSASVVAFSFDFR